MRGPVAPPWMRAAREIVSTSSTLSMRDRSTDAVPRKRPPGAAMLGAADDARAAAERNERDRLLLAEAEERRDVLLFGGVEDPVGRGGEVAVEAADEIAIAAAVGVDRALAFVRGADVRSSTGGE